MDLKSKLSIFLKNRSDAQMWFLMGRVQDSNFNSKIYEELILEMSAQVWNIGGRSKKDCLHQLKAINQILFEEYGLKGRGHSGKKIIDDPSFYYLHEVLNLKKGSPLSFTVLYSLLMNQIGLKSEILSVGSHYFLRVKDVVGDVYVEPFDQGKLMSPAEFQHRFQGILKKNHVLSSQIFELLTADQLMIRFLQQLKNIYVLKGEALLALRVIDLLSALLPESPELARDRGILYCEMEYFSKAMEDLTFYLQKRPQAEDKGEIKKLTSMLRGYREIMN